jgi:DNA polymerase I-like protein with 3'-5' exonuclease and polymerase domains
MAGFFDLPSSRSTKKKDQKALKKIATPVQTSTAVTMKGTTKLVDRIQAIISLVKSKFKGKEDTLLLINEEQQLIDYIDACIVNNIVAIDTETTGLDPILDQIVGMSLYTPGQKACYIPINHVSYVTGLRINNQLPVEFIRQQLQRLVDANTRSYWFNAPFDVRFIGNGLGVWFIPYFDASIASKCLNSNEPAGQRGLKPLHKKYCWGDRGEALSFGKLFDDVPFNYIPPDIGYLYAASDALYTWELAEFQSQYLEPDGIYYESHNMKDLSNVFFNIEMKSMTTFINMEQTGVSIDYDHAERISKKYHELADKMKKNLELVCEPYMDLIQDYRRKNPACRLTDPINFESPTQLAIILYDILKITPPDKKNPRGTGADILEQMDHPICRAILDNRSFSKVLSTYIDKLPEQAKKYPDKRIHCKFNQYGADTGRVSSDSPNLQNIPSNPFTLSDGTKVDSGHDVRQLFTASPGCVLLSCDYSGQEVRLTAHLSQDEKLIQAYKDGKDPYCEIASIAYNVPYDECKEFRPDGTTNPEGKARRSAAKKIVLGILYGRGIPSIAEQLGKTVKEAQSIYDKVLAKFEGLAAFIEESENMARELGYVTTVWGRRRQLPDMQLPYFEFSYKDGVVPDFDPLSDSDDDYSTEVPEEVVADLTKKLLNCWGYKKKEELKEKIRAQGINVKDNGSFIAQAQRQCVNARVQGSAADLTKLAQIELANNEELKSLGFKMLIPVHDEIIGECPIENVKRCAELMSYCMKHAGKDLCVPLSCDVDVFKSWYGEHIDIDKLVVA